MPGNGEEPDDYKLPTLILLLQPQQSMIDSTDQTAIVDFKHTEQIDQIVSIVLKDKDKNKEALKLEINRQIKNDALNGAGVEFIISLVISSHTGISKWKNGEISWNNCCMAIMKNTTFDTAKGGFQGAWLPAAAKVGQYAQKKGFAGAMKFGKAAGPALTILSLGSSTVTNVMDYSTGKITGGKAIKNMAWKVAPIVLPYAASTALGGPVGFVGTACINIGSALGEYFTSG